MSPDMRVNPGARNIPYTIRERRDARRAGPEDWQPTLAQTQEDRHREWKAAPQSSSVKLGPVICPLQCYQLQSASTP
ncbi:hypothetical protein NQZ68_013080 [Dissostichus eleginoides]|nr:hypothetical protein NQZ68_013080 [Dissostichus eleginoides]